jgi:hypothetical protein
LFARCGGLGRSGDDTELSPTNHCRAKLCLWPEAAVGTEKNGDKPMMSRYSMIVSVLSILAASEGFAHHSISPFDSERFEEFEGEITRLGWRNPHLTADVRVTDSDGSFEIWQIEGDAINALMRRGLTREDLAVGNTIRFGGWPSTLGRRELMPTNVLLADGREIVMMDLDFPLRWTNPQNAISAIDLDGESDDFFRVWTYDQLYERQSLFVLTERAQEAIARYDPFTDTPSLRCIAPGMPNANLNPYPIEFVNNGDHILLRIEEWEAERTIDLVSTVISRDIPRSRLGYSIGRLNGNILEIETGRLIDQLLDDDGIPMSEAARIHETYTIHAGRNILEYEVTVTDPIYLQEPATWIASWKAVSGAVIRPFECAPN